MRKIYTLLLSLILFSYATLAQTGGFTVTGESSSYSYSNGVLTVNNGANITISMTSGATTPTNDRIVVAENATATITLAGVNIKGSDCDGAQNIAAKSAIDLSNGSILTIALSENTENTLTGGSGSTDGSGAPGIHVPDNASLIIQGEGSLSVSGGTSSITYGGVGIGGNAGSGGNAGESCGTVIYFASGNVTITAGTQASGSVPADNIGGGNGQNQNNGDDGQGIKPTGDGTYTVYGDLELPEGVTFPENITLNIPSGTSLILPEGFTWPDGIQLTGDGNVSDSGKLTATITFADNVNLDKTYDTQQVSLASGAYTNNGNGTPVVKWYADNNGEKGEQLESAPINAGTYWVGVSAEATNLYQAAEEVTKKFTITPATATSPETPTLEAVTYGVKLSGITLPEGWTWENGEIVPTVTNTGYTAYYTVTDYTNYDWSNVDGWDSEEHRVKRTLTLTVNKADPAYEEPTGLTATYGQTLADVELPEGWAWEDETQSVGEAGEKVFKATFTPTDNNYNVVEDVDVKIIVSQADLPEESKIDISGGQQEVEFDGTNTTMTLTATVTGDDLGANPTWTWNSSNENVVSVPKTLLRAEVSDTKTVTIVGPGEATITAHYSDSKYEGNVDFTIKVKAKEEEPEPTPDPQPQPDPTPLYYNIQFENICEGVDASLSKGVVKEGNQVSVYVEVEEGYDDGNLKVLFKRSLYGYWEEVEEGVQPGEYIIYNVYADIYVKVEGVEKIEEEPTGMSDIESTKVYAQNGNLYVYTSQPQEVMIITMNGTVLRRERQEGLRSYPLPKGVYIICIGEERMKVRN